MSFVDRLPLPVVKSYWNPEKHYGQSKSYSYFEHDQVVSACQKAIRRGLNEAYQWFFELFFAGKAGRRKIWDRAMIIALEDVGPANPGAIIQVWRLSKMNYDSAHAMYEVCRLLIESPKSRVNDEALHACRRRVPSRSLQELMVDLSDAIERRDSAVSITYANAIQHLTDSSRDIWHVIGCFVSTAYFTALREVAQTTTFKSSGSGRLVWAHAIHLLIAGCDPKVPQYITPCNGGHVIDSLRQRIDPFTGGPLLGMPDYAIDMHTLKGRAMGRGHEHFEVVGSLLNNEDPNWKALTQGYQNGTFAGMQ